ncbi:MAG: tetratricopeptide repeat protein [Thermomicrobiales bacterium]
MSVDPGLPERLPNTLPIIPTSLVGRDEDAAHIVGLIQSGASRLVTITGPGGVGKTRLAIHVANLLTADFPDGIAWIPLAAVPTPDLVLPTILQHLGVHETSDLAATDRLLEAVQGRRILLVLDNLEHLLACAPALATIASASERAVLLATSQAPFGVSGEQVYPLQPLALPDPLSPADHLLHTDAVTLFVERAHAVNPFLAITDPDAATIATICSRLDGLPLAIELAAARSNVLDPTSLLARLDRRLTVLTSERRDVPDRLRTLRNAIAWSYDLLPPDEQRLFRWLSVFAGGIALEAIDDFPVGPDPDARSGLDLLAQLVGRSLVRATMTPGEPPRYLMLETLREFGHDRLRADGDDHAARTWHAEWIARLAIAEGAHLLDSNQGEAGVTLSREWENIRQALAWLLDHGSADRALAICGSIWRFWSRRGLATEGRAWTARALAAIPEEATPQRAEGLFAAGYLAEDQNDLPEAERLMLASLAISTMLEDARARATTLSALGSIAHDRSEYDQALDWHVQALAAADISGNVRARAVSLGNMGVAHFFRGDYAQARACWEEGIVAVRELGDRQGEAVLLANLGALLVETDDLGAARQILEQSLDLERTLGDLRSIGFCLTNLAEVLFRLGDLESPLGMLEESNRYFVAFDNPRDAAVSQITWARILLARGELHDALSTMRESLIALDRCGDHSAFAEAAELLAMAAILMDAAPDARTLLWNAAILRVRVDSPVRPSIAAETETVRRQVRALLGPDALPDVSPGAIDAEPPSDDLANAVIRIATGLLRRAESTATHTSMPVAPDPEASATPAGQTAADRHEYGLSDREMEVLRLLADGRSTREIAETLFIAPRTAATHVNNIIGKLGVSSRTAAVALAMRLGIV